MSAVRHDMEFAVQDGKAHPSGGELRPGIFEASGTEAGLSLRGVEILTAATHPSPEAGEAAFTNHPVLRPSQNPPAESGMADWTKTLTLVERAAATIKAYERRFLQLEKQTKALADRSLEDQHRLHAHIHALEERLKQAEERVVAAEGATRDAEYHEWEAGMRVKRAEQRAAEAETRCRQSEAYLRRVHELLSNVS